MSQLRIPRPESAEGTVLAALLAMLLALMLVAQFALPAERPEPPAVPPAGRGAAPVAIAAVSADPALGRRALFRPTRLAATSAENALRKLDVPPMQVMIEAAITEVSLTDDLRYGLQSNFVEGNENAVLTDGTSVSGLAREAPGFSFLFGSASSITGVLNALEGKTKVNVVSAPKLMTVNNGTATLQVGNQVPVLTQNSTATIDPNAPVINAIEYRDTGVILKITPRVNGSGLVLLDISQEVSDVLSSRASGSSINSPVISTRKVSTTVAVQDGEVMALGGLIRNVQTRDKTGIPFLSQIPIIGGLFGRQVEATDKIELVILLTPRVIRTVDDARAITEELRQKIRSLEPFSTTGEIP